jgi:hypothetical protein
MYKVIFNDSGIARLDKCKPWWQSFIEHGRKNIDSWNEEDYRNHINTMLSNCNVMINCERKELTFESEAHFTWFILRFSK